MAKEKKFNLLKEFKAFAFKGNVVDMAVGVVIGGAFTAIVTSLVGDIINPLLGLITGGKDFSNLYIVLKSSEAYKALEAVGEPITLAAAKEAGANVLSYGNLITAIVNFLLIALALFFVIKLIAAANFKARKEAEAAAAKAEAEAKAAAEAAAKAEEERLASIKICPFCLMEIKKEAKKCSYCASEQN